jgi:hypothetical protein
MDANLFAEWHPETVLVGISLPQNYAAGGTTKDYHYKALRSQNIAVGDRIVVDTSGKLCVQTVTKVTDAVNMPAHIKYKWVIQRVDTTVHDDIVERERKFNEQLLAMERATKKEQVRAQIEAKVGAEGLAKLTALLQ